MTLDPRIERRTPLFPREAYSPLYLVTLRSRYSRAAPEAIQVNAKELWAWTEHSLGIGGVPTLGGFAVDILVAPTGLWSGPLGSVTEAELPASDPSIR